MKELSPVINKLSKRAALKAPEANCSCSNLHVTES